MNLFRRFLALFVVSDAERLASLGLGDWRPISTAPRDGTDILATGRFISHAVVSWRHEECVIPKPLKLPDPEDYKPMRWYW